MEGSEGTRQLKGIVVDEIRQTKRLSRHEADFLRKHSPGDFKITLPTPNQFPAIAYKKGLSDNAYQTRSEFLWDVVPIIKSEIEALVNEGVRYIQIDARATAITWIQSGGSIFAMKWDSIRSRLWTRPSGRTTHASKMRSDRA